MKILAIVGSSKSGNTTEVLKYFEKKLTEIIPCNFEYLYLSDYDIDFCTGCHNCIFIGEDRCPHFLVVKSIEDRMLSADAVILATPGYMFSVTGIMKNFLDHVAYNCHRPKYFGRKAFLISSCTKWQEKSVFAPMQTWLGGAGFKFAGKLYVEMLPFPLSEKELDKRRTAISKAASAFAKELQHPQEIKPDFGGLMIFHAFRTLSKIAPNILRADYQYFSDKEAYKAETRWYIPTKVSYFKHQMANFMEKRLEKSVLKMIDPSKLNPQGIGFKNML
ncbi:MAG: flavodoxin family protein [Clostridia bacterium]|nr:flavodoxin family protein [Clostridia bacterium]